MKLCFLKLSLCLSIITTLISSCGNAELMSKLEDVESYLCEAPDSALAVLDSIPEESLSSGKLRAKYALLRSIALDKNYIDVTSDSIIRPAVEYYSRHGSGKERLETYYYRGVVSFNGKDLDSAADWFVKGSQFVGKSGVPPRMSAMTYFRLYQVYDAVYDFGKAYTSVLCAYDYFCEAEDVEFIIESLDDAVRAALILNRYDEAEALLDKMREYRPIMDQFQLGELYASDIQLRKCRKNFDSGIVDEYFSCVRDSSCIDWLALGDFYYWAGDYPKAKYFLENYDGDKESSDIYNVSMSHILYELGDYKGAYDCYSRYAHITDDREDAALESDISFKEERLLSELATAKHKNMIITTILVIIVLAVLIVFLSLWMKHLAVHAKERQKKLESEKEELESMMAEAESEKESLKAMMNEYMGEELRSSIKSRLSRLDRCLAQQMSGSLDSVHDELKSVLKDKRLFLEDTVSTIMFQHPAFLTYLKKHNLTKSEIAKCCLVLMGVDGKSMASFLEVKETTQRNAMYEIRKKLGLNSESRELKTFLNDKVKELEGEF